MAPENRGSSPMVSVIIPFFNRLELCILALQSVLGQTYSDMEILLIDDGSNDDIRKATDLTDPRIRYYRQSNQGAAAARNLGLDHAKGSYIAFLDADDLWLPEKIEKQISHMRDVPDISMSHTSYRRIDINGKPLGSIDSGKFTGRVFPGILKGCPIATPTVMLRRSIVDRGLRFRSDVRISEDILLWTQIASAGPILGIDEPLSLVRLHDSNAALSSSAQIEGYSNLIRHGIRDNPSISRQDQRQLASQLYTRMAAIAQGLGDLRLFHSYAFLSWLTLASPDGKPERGASVLARLLRTSYQWEQEDPQIPGPVTSRQEEDPLEALQRVLAEPSEELFLDAKHAALASRMGEEERLTDGPLFSVLVPTYNQAGFLPETLESLLSQTYPNWEAIIVDDGSTDATPAVLEAYTQRDSRFRVFRKPNGGVASALNRGLQEAQGEWIFWLSSDDLFQADKLSVHARAIRDNPASRFLHTHFLVLDDHNRTIYEPVSHHRGQVPVPEFQTAEFLIRNYICGISISVHASVFRETGGFNEALRSGQDFDMWLRISAKFRLDYIDQATCLIRMHPAQGTAVFYAAGILDSARACLDFLNEHPFQQLFPFLDLTRPDHIQKAITQCLITAADTDAFLTRAGFSIALLRRLREWLGTRCPAETRNAFITQYNSTAKAIMDSGLKNWAKRPFTPLPDGGAAECYVPIDGQARLEQHADDLRASGEFTAALNIARYLQLAKSGHSSKPRLPEAPVHEVDRASASLLSSYLPGRYQPNAQGQELPSSATHPREGHA